MPLCREKFFRFSEIFVVLSLLILPVLLVLILVLLIPILILLILLILLISVLILLVLVLFMIVFYRMFGCLSKIFVKCRFAVGNAPKTRRLIILHRRCAGMHRKYQRIL